MKRVLLIILTFAFFLASSCGTNEIKGVHFQEINIKNASNGMQEFAKENENENGIYLYELSQGEFYLLLNEKNVNKGEKAKYFEKIDMQIKENVLSVLIDEKTTDDYNTSIKNFVLLKVKADKNLFDTITIYKNGKKATIEVITSGD